MPPRSVARHPSSLLIDILGFLNVSPMQLGCPHLFGTLINPNAAMKGFSGDYRHRTRFTLSKRPSPCAWPGSDAYVRNPLPTERLNNLVGDQFKFPGVLF